MEQHSANSPQELLDRLDRLLAENPTSPSYAEDLNDPDYTLNYEQFQTLSSQFQLNTDYIAEKACQMLKAKHDLLPFRICSFGCGDGRFDKVVLTKISKQFPDAKLQYMGVDVNESSCQRARELLAPLNNVEAVLRCGDMQQLDFADIKRFDLVICVKVLFYMTSLEVTLACILKMMKPDGMALVIHTDKIPLLQLMVRFWLHEHKREFWTTPHVLQALDSLGVSYDMDCVRGVLDFTSCFTEGFQQLKDNRKRVLDFITHAKMSRYPPAVAETCTKYLSSIAYGKPDKLLIPHVSDVILVEGKTEYS